MTFTEFSMMLLFIAALWAIKPPSKPVDYKEEE